MLDRDRKIIQRCPRSTRGTRRKQFNIYPSNELWAEVILQAQAKGVSASAHAVSLLEQALWDRE